MKTFVRTIIIALTVAGLCHAGPATAPSIPLIGKWRVLSMGKKKLPEQVVLFWQFDDQTRVVSVGNGEVVARSQYTLSSTQGGRQIVTFKVEDKLNPVHVGFYEVKDGKLRIQVTIDTGALPKDWNEDEVMLLEPVPSK